MSINLITHSLLKAEGESICRMLKLTDIFVSVSYHVGSDLTIFEAVDRKTQRYARCTFTTKELQQSLDDCEPKITECLKLLLSPDLAFIHGDYT